MPNPNEPTPSSHPAVTPSGPRGDNPGTAELGNVIGALVASLMMGVAESLGVQYVGADSGLIVVFAMLLFTLAFKPTGLGGGRAR